MKKMLLIGSVVFMIFAVASCGKKAEETVEVPTGKTEETSAMELVSADEDFSSELGFHIDTSAIPVHGMARFIVDGKVAQMRFAIEKENSAPVDVMFRATAEEDRKESLFDTKGETSEPVSLTLAGIPVVKTEIREEEITHCQYFFEKDGIYCCFYVTGELETEELEALTAAFYNAVSK